jgi:hypothetical protein
VKEFKTSTADRSFVIIIKNLSFNCQGSGEYQKRGEQVFILLPSLLKNHTFNDQLKPKA